MIQWYDIGPEIQQSLFGYFKFVEWFGTILQAKSAWFLPDALRTTQRHWIQRSITGQTKVVYVFSSALKMTWTHTARTMKIPNPLEEEETVTALIEQPTELIQSLVISELMKIKGSFKDLCISIVTVLWWKINIPIESLYPHIIRLIPCYYVIWIYLVCEFCVLWVWIKHWRMEVSPSHWRVPIFEPLDHIRCAQGGRHLCSHSYRWHWYVPWSWCSACPLPSVLNTVCSTCITCITCTFGLKILKASRIWNVSTLDVLGRLMIARAFPGSCWRADVRAGTGRSATLMSSSRWICGDQSTG